MKKTLKIISSLFLTLILCVSMCSCDVILDFDFSSSQTQSQTASGNFAAHFLDVGQGDSIFIELPNSETMLIDTGENYHGESIINYISALGYSKIDYLVATHPHTDHIGSMSYIVRNFDIGSVYMPKVSANTKTYENLLTSIQNKGLKITTAQAGMNIFDSNGLTMDIIAPSEIDEDDLNNCSIIIKAVFGTTSFLFTGDAETEEFDTVTADMQADVLKVGHHGSRTSTTEDILDRIEPSIAVISCGEDNSYGHPHATTLKYLSNINCTVYRTDENKTIKITSDGKTLDVETNLTSITSAK